MLALLKRFRDWILMVGLLGTVGGVGCAAFLPGLWWRKELLAKPPHTITVSDLAQQGPGDNSHVVVTEYVCGNSFAFQIRSGQGNTQPVNERTGQGRAWIPLFAKSQVRKPTPDDTEAPVEPTSFIVLLQTETTSGNATNFHLLSRRQSMRGLAIPYRYSSVPSESREKLKTAYPDTDFSRCYVLEQVEPADKNDLILFAHALALGTIGGLVVGVPTLSIAILLSIFYPIQRRANLPPVEVTAAETVDYAMTTNSAKDKV